MKDKLKDIKIFAGGSMNLDADERLLKNNEFREVWNARMIFSDGSNVGALENIKGTTLISGSTSSDRVIGWCTDNDSVFYLVCDTVGSGHKILRLNSDNSIDQILYNESVLNFIPGTILDVNVINNILFWTGDGTNPPRSVDVSRAYNYTNSLGSYPVDSYSEITEQILNVLKYPPTKPITGVYFNDEDYNQNNLRGKLFQFIYRFIYAGNEESTWSPISDLIVPAYESFTGGGFLEQQTFNNVIYLQFLTGSSEVKKIDIAARVLNTGEWRLVKTFEKYDVNGGFNDDSTGGSLLNDICTYKFYNNTIGIVIDQEDSGRPFDYVPQLSKHQELIEKNRLLYADNTEGYNNVETDVELIPNDHWYEFPSSIVHERTDNVYSSQWTVVGSNYRIVWGGFEIDFIDGVSDQYKIFDLEIEFGQQITSPASPGQIKHFYYQTKPGDADYDVRDAFIGMLNGYISEIYDDGSTMYLPYASTNCFYRTNIDGDPTTLEDHSAAGELDNIFYIAIAEQIEDPFVPLQWLDHERYTDGLYLFTRATADIVKTFKTGAWHEYGMMYYDEQHRSGNVNTCKLNDFTNGDGKKVFRSSVYIPNYCENWVWPQTIAGFYWDLFWKINHNPPSWAKEYQWVYTKNTSVQFHQWYVFNKDAYTLNGSVMEIAINKYLLDSIEAYPEIKSNTYIDWQQGDRIKFLAIYVADDYNNWLLYDDVYDVEILGAEAGETDYVIKVGYFDLKVDTAQAFNILVEVYRPLKDFPSGEEDRVFYEIGDRMDIVNGVHSVTSGILAGDCYKKEIQMAQHKVPMESSSFSEYYDSKACGIGRPQIIDRDSKQERRLSDIRYGERLHEGTRINELHKFYVANAETLPQRYGAITKIKEIGYTLRVLQEYRCTSIYLSRAELEQAIQNGSSVVSGLTVVLGSQIPSEEKWGCQNPESVVIDGRSLFFADVKNGAIVRWATNGLFPVSNYNFMNEIKHLFEIIEAAPEDYKILGHLDGKYDEVCFTVNDVSGSSPSLVSSFVYIDEPHNKWMRFMEYGDATSSPEMFTSVGDRMYSFLRGQVWQHNTNSTRNLFHGVQRDMKIEVISNIEPLIKKVFESIQYNSNIKWVMSDNSPVCEMEIMPDSMNLAGMRSRLIGDNFHMHEGVYWSDFLQDEYSDYPTITEAVRFRNLFRGRDLMGNSMLIRMKNDLTSEVVLFSVEINSIKSY